MATLASALVPYYLPHIQIMASQVILHPTLSQTLKMWSTTVGRDKTYRAVQFAARFLAWYFLTRGDKGAAERWAALKGHLATARKLFRLGKPLEHLQAAVRATHIHVGDAGERLTTIAKQLCYFGYLSYDSIIWANAVKLITLCPERTQRLSKMADRFWFSGILFSIVYSLLKAGRLANEVKRLHSARGEKDDANVESERQATLRALDQSRAETRSQFMLDVLDIWIPATSLGLVHIPDGVVGIFGLTTSIMALRQQWKISGR